LVVATVVLAVVAVLLPVAPTATAAPIGQGFNLNASDLAFILKQIKISEAHATRENAAGEPVPGGALLGSGPDQVASPRLPFGLRTVDGRDNNLVAGQRNFGAADVPFPRTLTPDYKAPYGPSGNVTDPEPRRVSNLVVDQTTANPAAREAAELPADAPDAPGVPLDLPNVAPDVGLSAPYNSWFTIFGQFFDHGLDLIGKAGSTVMMPLESDDPLFNQGPNFMVLTRAAGGGSGSNSTSSFIDQSQTYTSHPAHQAFLREYSGAPGAALATGRMLTEKDGAGAPRDGLATWESVKDQSRSLLGITLADSDVLNVPLLATDQYGRFLRGPGGFAQLVGPNNTLVEGTAGGLAVPADAVRTGHAFLDDIAHNAVPSGTKTADDDTVVNGPGPVQAGRYDDEMLDEHFVAGDGRVNENIALTAVHHVFHSEHNRLAGPSSATGSIANTLAQPGNEALLADWNNAPRGVGERFFQAAKFVTEMQYQHLAFEEFARKVQPQVNLFGAYDTSIDPAITAEFAHVVYRFGHSMLTETVPRKSTTGTDAGSLSLLDAFLDPTKYDNTGALSADAAAGSLVRGLTRQVGQELDEFVTEALRNKLLGLPLDLATLNMARGRETGVPRLNEARRQFFASTNDPALKPYESWADFGFSIKHQTSLVNFVAAYGKHPTITGSLANRRSAAEALVNGDPTSTTTPTDAGDFLNATGSYTPASSGLDDVDFWIGGLAEKQQPFGGLLGNTFNFVFETQMENLQDGDRFYYLSRTAGTNMLTQLEGNSFAELISRNTDASGLPADSFSRPDWVFNVGALLSAPTGITDDPETEVNEADRTRDPGQFLSRTGDQLRYSGAAHVVFNGTANGDNVIASEGDDTIRGNDGNDRAESGAGNDNIIGGDGDDIISDSFGDDVLKGGDGDDAMSSGQGFDLNQGGLGQDFVIGGSDPTETFGGPGNDMVIAGGSADTVFGDDGDDWIEGGNQNDLLQGDNGAPFQDDVNEAGHDVIRGDGGDDDYDSEGGDDIMVAGPGIERSEGMRGFDWTIHKGDPQPANADMNFTGLLPDTLDTLRDRYDLTESLSGWNLDDTLRGDSRVTADLVGHELNAAGMARVAGLQTLVGTAPLNAGNILLGGAGSDLIEGRGGNDVIDGDGWLNVQLRAPDPAAPGTFKLVDTMSQLQADVQAGRIDPGLITIVRTAVAGSPGTNDFDTAVFSGLRAEYDFTPNADTMTVVHARGTTLDGTDRVNNVERLTFADGTIEVTAIPGNTPATGTVTISDTTPAVGQALTATPAITDADTVNAATLVFSWQAETAANAFTTVGTGTTFTPTANQAGQRLRVVATFSDGDGVNESVTSAPTGVVGGGVVAAPTVNPASGTFATAQSMTMTAAAGTTIRYTVGTGTTVPADPTATTGTLYSGAVPITTSRVVKAAAFNAADNASPIVQRTYTISPNAAPTVTARVPGVNSTNGVPAANITVTFSEAVTGVSATTFQLRNVATGALIGSTVTRNGTTNQWILNPTPTLGVDTRYAVTLTGGATAIRDLVGNPFATTSWSFLNGPAPTVTARTPAVNAIGVGRTANVTASFSEGMAGVATTTFFLRSVAAPTIAIPATVTRNGTTNQWILNPGATLAANTQYRVTVTGGTGAARDAAGNPLATTTWLYTTGAA
jgi:Ca2+-binding RTX toxin-like protein